MARAWPIPDLKPDVCTGENIAPILNVRFKEFLSHRPGPDPSSEQLHDLRIAGRRLRYCLEFFRSPFSHTLDETIAQIKEMQETLGSIHDLDVLGQSIAELGDGQAPAIIRLRKEMIRRRATLLQQFQGQWGQLTHPEFRQWLQDLLGQVAVSPFSR